MYHNTPTIYFTWTLTRCDFGLSQLNLYQKRMMVHLLISQVVRYELWPLNFWYINVRDLSNLLRTILPLVVPKTSVDLRLGSRDNPIRLFDRDCNEVYRMKPEVITYFNGYFRHHHMSTRLSKSRTESNPSICLL